MSQSTEEKVWQDWLLVNKLPVNVIYAIHHKSGFTITKCGGIYDVEEPAHPNPSPQTQGPPEWDEIHLYTPAVRPKIQCTVKGCKHPSHQLVCETYFEPPRESTAAQLMTEVSASCGTIAQARLVSNMVAALKLAEQDSTHPVRMFFNADDHVCLSVLVYTRQKVVQEGLVSSSLVDHHTGRRIPFCHTCNTILKRIKKCAACGLTSYCSATCQKANWAQHKNICHKNTK